MQDDGSTGIRHSRESSKDDIPSDRSNWSVRLTRCEEDNVSPKRANTSPTKESRSRERNIATSKTKRPLPKGITNPNQALKNGLKFYIMELLELTESLESRRMVFQHLCEMEGGSTRASMMFAFQSCATFEDLVSQLERMGLLPWRFEEEQSEALKRYLGIQSEEDLIHR
jgi:hypothetical protein